MANYNKEELSNLGIYELRSVARAVGVKSPTTKKAKELIDGIIKIQNGEEKAFVSKKGRPPKSISFEPNFEKDLAVSFDYANESCSSLMCDSNIPQGINKITYICYGIIKQQNGNYYFINYGFGFKYVQIPLIISQKYNLRLGDFVYGYAYELVTTCGILQDVLGVNMLNFAKYENSKKDQSQIINFEDINQIYDNNFNADKINIIVEMETNLFKTNHLTYDNIFIYSKQRDDIVRSYNALLDASNIVKYASQNNIPFTMHMVDIDYIFMLLNIYGKNMFDHTDIEAGEYLKNILLNIKESQFGNINIYAKNTLNRNIYLDAIIKKYL